MRYNKIRRMDISNGPGYRVSLFTQGCVRHCPGCFNEDTWDSTAGTLYSSDTEELILQLLSNPNVVGLSVLGGEPLLQDNLTDLERLFTKIRKFYPSKTIWLWTGFCFNHLDDAQLKVASLCDTLVTGPYLQQYRDLTLKYAGSKNQQLWIRSNNKWTNKPIE